MVNHAIREALEGLTALLKRGLPEIGLPSLEPWKLDNFSYDGSVNTAKIKANFTDMKLYGLSTMTVSKVDVDMTKMKFELKLKFSNLTIIGQYKLEGKVLLIFPISGEGPFEMTSTDVEVEGESTLKSYSNGSLSLAQLTLKMEVDDVKAHFHKLLGGGMASGVANRIIDFFGERIFDTAKVKLVEKLQKATEMTINRKLETINIFKS